MSALPATSDRGNEKAPAFTAAHALEGNRYDEGLGDLQVFKTADSEDVKLASDGKTVLIPQPSDDPNDPLNWSFGRKHLALASLIFASLLTDFGMTYGSVVFFEQSLTFHMSVPATANSISGGLFLQGPGGIVVVPLIQRFGRLPVLFWSQFLSAMWVMAAALAPGYGSFTAFRALQGFFNTAPQVVGLSVVHDLFFFHERTRRVNLWVFCLLGGPFLGPFLSAWIIQAVDWRADYGILAGLYGFSCLLVVLIGEETLYDRQNPQSRPTGVLARIKLLLGVTGAQVEGRPTLWTVTKDLVRIQIRPQIFFITVIYVMVLVCWVIGIVSTWSEIVLAPPWLFSPDKFALSYLAPLIGAFVGQLWGHFFNDWLQNWYIRTHHGVYVLENRLWGTYAPTLIGFTGLILVGQTLQHTLSWMGLCLGWAFLVFAMVSATTAISAYCLDCFPKHASLVAAIINMWRTTGGFCVVYFQLKWIASDGPSTSFGIQAMLLGLAFFAGPVLTQILGRRWRMKYPPPKEEN